MTAISFGIKTSPSGHPIARRGYDAYGIPFISHATYPVGIAETIRDEVIVSVRQAAGEA
jgi:hypothetical protein